MLAGGIYGIWLLRKENSLPEISEPDEWFVDLAHQAGGSGLDELQVEEIGDLRESHDEELTEEELSEDVFELETVNPDLREKSYSANVIGNTAPAISVWNMTLSFQKRSSEFSTRL